jgi:outer membrane immunogenic protein
MEKLIAALLAGAAMIAPAAAADIYGRGDGLSLKDAPIVDVFTWTGLYVGIHGGYATGDWDGTLTYDPGTGPLNGIFDPAHRSIDGDGFTGGIQAGFNWQTRSPIVIGLEADVSWADLDGDNNFLTKDGFVNWRIKQELDWYATVRGRLGYSFGRFLIYGTGGVAFGKTEADEVVTQCCLPPDNITARASADDDRIGWAAGAGLEWMIRPNWSLKGEWLHVDLGDGDQRFVGTNFITNGKHTTDSFPGDLEFDTFTVGLNYKLN